MIQILNKLPQKLKRKQLSTMDKTLPKRNRNQNEMKTFVLRLLLILPLTSQTSITLHFISLVQWCFRHEILKAESISPKVIRRFILYTIFPNVQGVQGISPMHMYMKICISLEKCLEHPVFVRTSSSQNK